MNCNSLRDELLDLATGVPASGEADAHLRECAGCREQLSGLRATMSAMDEWVAPEPSPYFDTRLQATLREEQEKQREPRGIFAWLRRPAFAGAGIAALVIGASITMFQGRHGGGNQGTPTAVTATGTAVGDLQYLDSHADLLTDFDLLDDMDNDSRTYEQ
jgi:predicted anti-sigma-YlaC factor YlaD